MESKTKTTAKKTTTTRKPVTKGKTSNKTTAKKVSTAKRTIDTVKKTVETSKEDVKKVNNEKPDKELAANKTNVNNEKDITKKKNKIKPIFKILLLVIVLALATYAGKKIIFEKPAYKDKPTYTTSFFIRNNKGKFALFNESGKKISDFIYDAASVFVNGSALVYQEKEGYAIINKKGKEIVPYGEYDYISNYSGVYKAKTKKGYQILNSKGKAIIEGDVIDINTYGDDFPFSIITVKNEIKVISYDGKTITTFKKDENAKYPSVNHVNEYSTIYYNGENVVFNAKTKKIITKFKKDNHYCVSSVSEDGKIMTFNACASWFETLTETGYLISVKGNITDLSKKCNSLRVYGNTVLCGSSDGEHFVNISGKKASLGTKVDSRVAFVDNDNYVVRNNKDYKLDFYKKGKKVKSMEASLSAVGKMHKSLYVLYVDGNYAYYDGSGKKAINEKFKYAYAFDQNGVAIVSKDGSSYYLINEKGKKVSDKYTSITNYQKYYQVSNKDGLRGIITQKGKEIIPTKYTSISIKLIRDKYYAVAAKDDTNYAIYDLDKTKLIKESDERITINEHYIKISGKKLSYYTYKGKLFYKE